MTRFSRSMTIVAAVAMATMAGVALGQNPTGKYESAFYKDWPLFSTQPNETVSSQTIGRFGPVGISIELFQPAFQMRIAGIEKGSPAAAIGSLKVGQIIETINGQKLKDIDPRIQLGRLITQAEATDGKVRLMVKAKPEDKAEEVVVQIPVLGAYSKTWPLNCPKSDKIVRNMADYLARTGNHAGLSYDLGLLFMLSTGEEKDLEVARGWVREVVEKNKDVTELKTYPWFAGWGGIGLCEYYLRTGDASVLPLIEKVADYLKRTMYNNGWSCRGGAVQFNYYAGGQLNAAGVHCVTTLLLARECGVKVDEYTLQAALRQFYRFAGHGNTPYGDHYPESGFVDNGKVGGLAFAMAAAASLTPEGESSVYAKARDISAVKGFYSTSWMLHGHTGGGIGELWRSSSMGLMVDKKPAKYREFMDNRMWHYELSRRFDGSFGILGGERYDNPEWGTGYALTYTIPRKTLRISGAKPTRFCKTYKLPERPWGTAADEVCLSLAAAPDKAGQAQDVDAEKLATDASWPILRKVNDTNVTDAVLLMYCRHPDQGVREMAYGAIRTQNRDHLIVELLKDKDPRARHSGAMIVSLFAAGKNRPAVPERLTGEMAQLLIGMINDPAESWWIVRNALVALSMAKPEALAPHVDRLCYWMQRDEWWLQSAAMGTLAGLGADQRYYKQVLPVIGGIVASNRVMSLGTQWGPLGQLRAKLQEAAPEVQAFAVPVLGKAYAEIPRQMTAPGGQNMDAGAEVLVGEQAAILAGIPGGLDELYKRGHARYPGQLLPHKELLMAADPAKLGPELKQAITEIVRDQLIYEYMGRNRAGLLAEASPVQQASRYLYSRLGGLVGLYNKVGVSDYNWHAFGPELRNGTWEYFTFDPLEKEGYDLGGWRYRKVTLPAGMEKWFEPGFDAAAAGWKKGQSPFGQKDGKLMDKGMDYEVNKGTGKCGASLCGEHDPMHTLWDKEVLLMRGTFQFPPLQPGHVYRLVIGTGAHVGSGSGYRLYLNGKQLTEETGGVGKREAGTIRGAVITTNLYPEFAKGPVTIAATSFLRYQDHLRPPAKPPVAVGIFSVWLEEMKLPPLDDATFQKSATVIPMTSSEWQAKQNNPDTPEVDPAEGKFTYDGKFVANAKLLGNWQTIAIVPDMAAFDPAKPGTIKDKNAPFKELTLKDGGLTGDSTLFWSGDTLLDLNRYQALKMTLKGDYLFVEAGGFNEKNPFGWKSPLVVLKGGDR